MEGRKDDQNKLRMDLIPPDVIEAMAAVLTDGAKRYGNRNWEQGMAWSRPYAALLRHILAWWKGEDRDPDSGRPHLWHALCCATFLVAYEQRAIGVDDRPNGSAQRQLVEETLRWRQGGMQHSYTDEEPEHRIRRQDSRAPSDVPYSELQVTDQEDEAFEMLSVRRNCG